MLEIVFLTAEKNMDLLFSRLFVHIIAREWNAINWKDSIR